MFFDRCHRTQNAATTTTKKNPARMYQCRLAKRVPLGSGWPDFALRKKTCHHLAALSEVMRPRRNPRAFTLLRALCLVLGPRRSRGPVPSAAAQTADAAVLSPSVDRHRLIQSREVTAQSVARCWQSLAICRVGWGEVLFVSEAASREDKADCPQEDGRGSRCRNHTDLEPMPGLA